MSFFPGLPDRKNNPPREGDLSASCPEKTEPLWTLARHRLQAGQCLLDGGNPDVDPSHGSSHSQHQIGRAFKRTQKVKDTTQPSPGLNTDTVISLSFF